MWQIGNRTLIGKSHLESGVENQDKCMIGEIRDCVLFVLSDGAGSARFGAYGASSLVNRVHHEICSLDPKLFSNLEDAQSELERAVKIAVGQIHQEINCGKLRPKKKKIIKFLKNFFGSEEDAETEILDNYAATLLVAVVSADCVWMAHLGDGYMAGGHFSEADFTQTVCSLPENGEYENQTYFFTDHHWEEHLRVTFQKVNLDFFVAMTDGADPFLISSDRTSLEKSLVKKISDLNLGHSEISLSEVLRRLFTDERVYAVSSDDTTFCVALR